MMRYSEQTQAVSPASVPVSLEIRQVSVSHLVALGGLVLGLLSVAALAAWLGSLVAAALPALSLLLWLLTALALSLALLVAWLIANEVRSRLRYHEWLNEWHAAALARYESGASDAVQSRAISLELSTDNVMHVLSVALYLHQRIQCGATPTVRALEGPLFLAGRRVGDLSRDDAAAMLNVLAARGLIAGRAARTSGVWLPATYDDVVGVILENRRLESSADTDWE